jgi:phosphoenolpyruvate carboxylase
MLRTSSNISFQYRRLLALRNPTSNLVIRCLSQSDHDPDAKLRHDIKMLGQMLGSEIKKEAPAAYDHVETLRALGRKWRKTHSHTTEETFSAMVKHVEGLDDQTMKIVARAFTHFLSLSNTAENRHRVRRIHEKLVSARSDSAFSNSPDSCDSIIRNLASSSSGISPAQVAATLFSQSVEIVLTAHPTEVNRRTTLKKYQRVDSLLEANDNRDKLTLYEQKELEKALRREVSGIWASSELKMSKPTPTDEARVGLAIVENVLWASVPQFLRRLDVSVQRYCGTRLPLTTAPVRYDHDNRQVI